jgi:hypothetical protein
MSLRWISIGAAALAAALAAGLWTWTTRPASTPPAPGSVAAAPATSVEARLAALQKELAAERDARLGLETEVEMLRLMLEESGGAARIEAPAGGAAESAGAAPPAAGAAAEARQGEPEANPSNDRLWFDEPALARSGLPPHEIARLERVFEESELAVLHLRDRATREGWAGTPRFPQELHDLRAGLRAEVGDETFDWLLYATQRPNRVAVRSLLSTGAASQAGVREGDLILRYDGRTIFRGGELQNATRQGEAGRPVAMEVMSQNGDVRKVIVPSGPLGIQLGERRLAPQTGR